MMNIKPKTDSVANKPKLKWHHYFIAAVVAYLLTWVALLFYEILFLDLFAPPYNRLHLSDFDTLTLSVFLFPCIPGAINFLILWPFLRHRIMYWMVFALLVAGWVFFFNATIVAVPKKF